MLHYDYYTQAIIIFDAITYQLNFQKNKVMYGNLISSNARY